MWPPIGLSPCTKLKKKADPHLQLCWGCQTFAFILRTRYVQSVRVIGDKERCVYVKGGRKGQTRPHKGAWDLRWRDRVGDREKIGSNKRWKRGWKDVSRGWGHWVRAKTGSNLCQLGRRGSAHSLSRAGTLHWSMTVQAETPHSHTHTHTGKLIAEWMNALDAFPSVLFLSNLSIFQCGWSAPKNSINWASAHFYYSADGEEVGCPKINELRRTKSQLSLMFTQLLKLQI